VPVSLSKIDHFVVFRGRVADRVVLADPAFGNRIMHTADFEKVWRKKVGFVVTRPDAPPSPNRLAVGVENLNVVSGIILSRVIH